MCKIKEVDATFKLNFTTSDYGKLPSERKMQIELENLFETVLDNYLIQKDVECDEIHLILCDDFTIEDYN